MNIQYPFTLNSVLPYRHFFSLRDEFLYNGWRLTNYSGYNQSNAEDKVAWKLNNLNLSLIHISEPTRRRGISYAVFCLKKKK